MSSITLSIHLYDIAQLKITHLENSNRQPDSVLLNQWESNYLWGLKDKEDKDNKNKIPMQNSLPQCQGVLYGCYDVL